MPRSPLAFIPLLFVLTLSLFQSCGRNDGARGDGSEATVDLAPMPYPNSFASAAVVDGQVYLFGGRQFPNILQKYDPVAGTWSFSETLKWSRSDVGMAAVGGKLYIMGGHRQGIFYNMLYTGNGTLPLLEVFDPATGVWTEKSPMPTSRSNVAVAVVNGRIYAIGGFTGLGSDPLENPVGVGAVEEYDPLTDKWTARAPMPTPRAALTAAVYQDRIYAFGGDGLNAVEIYDPASDSWSTGGRILKGRSFLLSGVVRDKIYLLGGGAYDLPDWRPWARLANVVEEYDPATGESRLLDDLALGRFGSALAVVDNRILLMGGKLFSGKFQMEFGEGAVPGIMDGTQEYLPPATHAQPGKLKFRIEGSRDGDASINDTLTAHLDFNSPGRINRTIRWRVAGGGDADEWVHNLSDGQGSDSLRYVCPPKPGYLVFHVELRDEKGTPWSDSIRIRVVEDLPRAYAGSDIVNFPDERIPLAGKAFTRFGRIAKWEWDPTGDGTFIATSGADTILPPLPVRMTGYKPVLRVTDNDGRQATDTLDFRVDFSRLLAPMNIRRERSCVVEVEGTLFVIGGGTRPGGLFGEYSPWVEEYSIASNTWRVKNKVPADRRNASCAALNGKIYLVGGLDTALTATPEVSEYDPAAGTWSSKAPMSVSRANASVAALNGKLYVLGGAAGVDSMGTELDALEAFDPESNQWQRLKGNGHPRQGASLAAMNGKLYAAGGYRIGNYFADYRYSIRALDYVSALEEYDPVADSWKDLPGAPSPRSHMGLMEVAGRLYAAGGVLGLGRLTSGVKTVEVYDFNKGRWWQLPDLALEGLSPAVAFGSSIYSLDHTRGERYFPPLD